MVLICWDVEIFSEIVEKVQWLFSEIVKKVQWLLLTSVTITFVEWKYIIIVIILIIILSIK